MMDQIQKRGKTMNMSKRLSRLEENMKATEKYKGCELEIHPGVNDDPTQYYCAYPDGHRELLTDSDIIKQLEDTPGDEISVEVID